MSVSITKTQISPLPGGMAIASGEVTFDSSYPTGGETFDISAYLKSAGNPNVFVIPQSAGWWVAHDGGTAAAGKLLVYGTGGAEKGTGTQVDNATDLSSLTCTWFAIGPVN